MLIHEYKKHVISLVFISSLHETSLVSLCCFRLCCIDDVGMSRCFWNLLFVTFKVLKIKVECNEPRLEYTKNDYDSFISSIVFNRNSS